MLYIAALYFGFVTNQLNLSWIYDNYLAFLTASVIFGSVLSVYLYARSFAGGAMLCDHAHTGYVFGCAVRVLMLPAVSLSCVIIAQISRAQGLGRHPSAQTGDSRLLKWLNETSKSSTASTVHMLSCIGILPASVFM